MTEQNMAKDGALSWSEERVDVLRKLWLEGLSASRIAAELGGGVTRNAVIGKVHRLGLSGRVKAPATANTVARRPVNRPSPAQQRQPQRQSFATHGNAAVKVDTQVEARPLRTYDGNVVPLAQPVTIMELRESMCRWPVGDPSSADFRYCGGKAPIGEGPYCSFHSRMAYQPTQDRRRKTA